MHTHTRSFIRSFVAAASLALVLGPFAPAHSGTPHSNFNPAAQLNISQVIAR